MGKKNKIQLLLFVLAMSGALFLILSQYFRTYLELVFPRPERKTPEPLLSGLYQSNQEKFNWDVIGLASVATALVSSAIVYTSGWVYEAHWYSHYNINLSQIELQPFQIMVQGIPGVLFFTLMIILSLLFRNTFQWVRTGSGINSRDTSRITFIAYHLGMGGMMLILVWSVITDNSRISSLVEIYIAIIPGIIAIILLEFAPTIANDRNGIFQTILQLPYQTRRIIVALDQSWLFTIFIGLVFLFLTSISFSAVIGEFDAQANRRTVDGKLYLQQMCMYSDEPVIALQESYIKRERNAYKYGPLILVSSNETTLFIYELENPDSPPKLIVFPRKDTIFLSTCSFSQQDNKSG